MTYYNRSHGDVVFQRRHFEFIASVIERMVQAGLAPKDRDAVAQLFATKLASTNPNFHTERFLSACRGEAYKIERPKRIALKKVIAFTLTELEKAAKHIDKLQRG